MVDIMVNGEPYRGVSQSQPSSASRTRLPRRRRYHRSIGAAPELTEAQLDALPAEQRHAIYTQIRLYQAEAHNERLDDLTPRRAATIGPTLDQIEQRADAEGWPQHLMNSSRPFFARDARGKLLAPFALGFDIDAATGTVADIHPPLTKSPRKPLPPAHTKPAAAMTDLEVVLAGSVQLAREARDQG
jgi:hypothetical protein